MKSTRTGKIEARLQKQQAEVMNNRRELNDLRDDYRNALKTGREVDDLTDKALRINGLQARQQGLEVSVEVTKEKLAESQKYDDSPEAKAGRKRISELGDQFEGLQRYGWQAVNDLVDQLKRMDDVAGEYNRLHKQIDGTNPNIKAGKRGMMIDRMHKLLCQWLDDIHGMQLKI